jgi:hypothetical protein
LQHPWGIFFSNNRHVDHILNVGRFLQVVAAIGFSKPYQASSNGIGYVG